MQGEKRRARLLAVMSFLLVLLLGGMSTSARVGETGPEIHLQRATFEPLAGEPVLPGYLRAEGCADGVRGYYLVQFKGPVREEWKQELERLGGELLDYIPDFAFIVRMEEATKAQVQNLSFVRWAGPYHPAYKLHHDLDELATEAVSVVIQTFPGEDIDGFLGTVTSLGGEISSSRADCFGGYTRATLPASRLLEVARLAAVSWIEPYIEPRLHNDVARSNVIMDVEAVWQRLGLYGEGQVVAIADTGLDTGDEATLSADFRGRVLAAYALGRPGDWSDPNGHGTHVAGSALGNGYLSGSDPWAHSYTGSFAGVAPEAKLVLQSVMDAEGSLSGIPDDYDDLFGPPYSLGARIHSDSWGGPTGGTWENPEYGGYDADARQVDEFAWTHKDMVILNSAGNEGVDADGDGVIDLDSIGSPATAKNLITVGATESQRDTYEGDTWGAGWPDDYPAFPISGDHISDNPDGVAAFSSRGPADDGRIKPDVAAPGTNIVSARSHHPDAETGWGEYNEHYIYNGGTSMACPLVAGAAAIVRDWYNDVQGLATPTSALIKATLINGAEDIGPGQYGAGAYREIPRFHPNNVIGWGRVNLKNSIMPDPPSTIWYDDHTDGLSTGQSITYDFFYSSTVRANPNYTLVSEGLSDDSPDWGKVAFIPPSQPRPLGEPGSGLQRTQSCNDYITDGGFEAGGVNWWVEGLTSLSSYAHGGNYSAYLGDYDNGEDWLWQTIDFPSDATEATLSFWFDQDSEETFWGYYDFFGVAVYDADWEEILVRVLLRDGPDITPGWTQVRYNFSKADLEAVRGQTVQVAFVVSTDYADPTAVWVDDVSLRICTGEIGPSSVPFRVTLVWTDYPGSLAAAKALVNDLDLEVIGPDGTHYFGNGGPGPDRLNNVEDVVVVEPSEGHYQVVVTAYNVPQGPQPYAIVASGPIEITPTPTPIPTLTPTPGIYLPMVIKNYGLWR